MDRFYVLSEYMGKCPSVHPRVDWWQLVPTHTLIINAGEKAKIFTEALNKAGTYTNLARKIGVSRKAVSQWRTETKNLSVYSLKLLLKFIGKKPRGFNDKILEVGGIRNPKLPFNLKNPQGAELVAAFLSDGHLPKQSFKNPMYCAGEHELHERLISICRAIFGDFEVDIKNGHKTLLTRFPCPIGTALERAGVPRGDKRRKNPYLPRYILSSKESIRAAYLRRVFDDEGDVYNSASKRAVRITRSTDIGKTSGDDDVKIGRWIYGVKNPCMNNLILGEQLLLRRLGIDARLYPEGVYHSENGRTTLKWRIQIAQQDNIRLFAQKIGFNYSIKREKLKLLLAGYRQKKSPDGMTENLVWARLSRLLKKDRIITYKTVGKIFLSLGLTRDYASAFLKKFCAYKKIRKVRRGVYIVQQNN